MKHLSRLVSLKAMFAATAVAALATLVPALAVGAYGPPDTSADPVATATVYMKDGKGGLRFVAPKTAVAGEDLRIVNQTNPHQVGPHTFSLVTKSSLPKTPKARQLCFTKDHICKAIAGWHGVKGNGPVSKNPAEAGEPGWDTSGSVSIKGDSWFTGEKPGTSIVQQLTADASAGPTRIYFLCAIHSWMQGSINVLPAGS